MARIELFKRGSRLNRCKVYVPDDADSATLYSIYQHKGGIRNFIRFVLAFIREQSDECDYEDFDDLGEE